MHKSSYEHMKEFVDNYFISDKKTKILDVGSMDVNGSYKKLFDSKFSSYIGVDIAAGNNVDVVLKSPYKLPFSKNSFDYVISGQAFEHIEFFWITWKEMVRVTKPDGFIFLIAPSRGPVHDYPLDCWRFYPDGFRALAKLENCELLSVNTDWDSSYDEESSVWGDTYGVFLKKDNSLLKILNKIW
jgi:SAM-dependent methyltransferase